MSINATLLGQMIVFILLIWFTMTFVWPVLLKAMEDRATRIADGLAAAEKGKQDLESAETKAAQLVQEGKGQVAELIAQAHKRGDDMIEEAKQKALEEAQRIVSMGHAQVDQEITQARESLRGEVSRLALVGVEQVLMREVDATAHREVLDKLSAEL